mgnify:CR=1 FL=1
MEFTEFLKHIPKIKSEILLGSVAHEMMVPPERKDLMENFDLNKVNPREAGIMMLLYPKNGQTYLALILRNTYKGVHSSQIAFPGGKTEPEDISLEHTALRETHEEIGISPDKITVIRPFTPVYIPPSNFMVFPFLGYATQELAFVEEASEVAAMIELSLQDFLDDTIVVNKMMATSYSTEISVPAFKIADYYVWGATAMMMSELKEVLKSVL